jgi:hypothetical protein
MRREVAFHNQVCDLDFRQPPEAMATFYYEQGSVVGGNVVEMDTHGDHPVEQVLRRLSVQLPLLDGPGTEAFHLNALRNADCPILMPAERPIGRRVLVEHNCANGKGRIAKQFRYD